MTNIIELTTTMQTLTQARQLGRRLVELRLAACVQVTGPIESIYRWQGEVCESSEFRCTIKSIAPLLKRITHAILETHPYDLPEILVTDVVGGSEDYADWLRQQVVDEQHWDA